MTEKAIAVDIDQVEKVYGSGAGSFRALSQIDLTIHENEFFTLLGPSGCGKTTLLRMIAGFEMPSAGVIRLRGQDIQNIPAHQRRVNTVFQSYALFPHLTIAQNIAFGLENLKVERSKIKARVAEMLKLVHMDDFAERKPDQLSGGQKQRVALARALAPEPAVLLLDEPLSALDLKLRQAMRNELRNLQRQTGLTFIFVTHDQEEALDMSDRICVLGKGQVQQVGTPREIYENPSNRFVADFIGDTNFIEVQVTDVNSEQATVTTPWGLTITAAQTGAKKGKPASLSIRPEKINLGAQAAGIVLDGTILSRNYLGGYTHYVVQAGATQLRISARNQQSNNPLYEENQPIPIGFQAQSVRILGL